MLYMNSFHEYNFLKKEFFGNIEIKTILDLILSTYIIKRSKNKLFLLIGLSETGKSFSIKKLSRMIGQNIPVVFSNGSIINSIGECSIAFLNQLIRKSIGIKFYQENLIVEGKLSNLKIKNTTINKKNNLSNKKTILSLQLDGFEKFYDISQGLLKKIVEKNIKIGDSIIINRTTGDVFKEHSVESNCFGNRKNPNSLSENILFDKVLVTEELVTLEELDNINLKDNLLGKYFSNQFVNFNSKSGENLDEILIGLIKTNKMKMIRGFLIIDDINLLAENSFFFIKQLLFRFVCPLILCIGSTKPENEDFSMEKKNHIPLDFIRSSVLSSFKPFECKEFFEIIKYTTFKFNICIKISAISLLVKIGLECGLKYALHLLSISTIFKIGDILKLKDIRKSYNLFFNCKSCLLFTGYEHFKIFYE